MAANGTCNNGVCAIVDNPDGISASTQMLVQAGGTADPNFTWLYPYDRTVFPRGLVSPTMQFGGSSPDSAYVRIRSMTVDYSGYFKVTPVATPSTQSAIQVMLPQKSWDAVCAAALGTDPIQVSVTESVGGKAVGPIKESWTIASGLLRGIVYHETYNSEMLGSGSVGIMQVRIGDTQPTVLKQGCGNVCHSASADGSTLVADTSIGASASYDLTNAASLIHQQSDDTFAYGGLYPDGTMVMSSTNYLGGTTTTSRLYDTKTGANIPAPGWDDMITAGGTTAFSPDGKHLTFVHQDKDSGHTISMIDFDAGQKQFSNLIDLATDPNSTLAWPAFTPDAKWVIYHSGSSTSYATGGGATADLFIVDVATHTAQRLDALDGYTGSGSATYLPANDPALSFTPTVLPVAVGGYFWTIFTSHRAYGNTLDSMASSDALGKLWIAAIDINSPTGRDPSHPAFYLDGQELNADNLRGFITLPPCQANGTSCTSGIQCCGGYCGQVSGGLQCTSKPPPQGCSKQDDKCTTSADCCDGKDICINGRCALPPPPEIAK
jgi:hypothetical protein